MKHYLNANNPMQGQYRAFAQHQGQHFSFQVATQVATITLNRPDKKNPLTFDSYAELRDLFMSLGRAKDVAVIVVTGSGGNFCSGGDVHEIIAPLTAMSMAEQLEFTRMTGALVLAMRTCPQPVIAAIDGVCAGAGAMMALAADMRYGTPNAKAAFLFTRVGLAGADMGACSLLPRIIGHGRASELLYSGRAMGADEGLANGFYNALFSSDNLQAECHKLAHNIANGPTFAHSMTKTMLNQEWNMTLEQCLEAEAQAQAICMQTKDFRRAYEAFAAKQKPEFKGN